jgi:SAM-dependent methyltransferase
MQPDLVDFLQTDEAQQACLDLMAGDLAQARTLPLLAALRRRFSGEQAGALLMLARLRRRASAKFPHAERMFFNNDALEQATAWPVALHRAERLDRAARAGDVFDLGCGVGGDALALAQFRRVIAYERDPERLALARANAQALGLAARIDFRPADWVEEMHAGRLPPAAAAFVDPGRRSQGRRLFDPEELIPRLSVILRLEEQVQLLVVKLMPGLDRALLPEDSSVEFISHDGVCKEAVLWRGLTKQPSVWASVHRAQGWAVITAQGELAPTGPLTAPCILYEPNPAVIRAGAVAELCAQLDGWLFDPQIAYIVAASDRPTPFAQAFRIHEVHRFGLKLLNQRLAVLGVGQVEIKRRGFPMEPEELRSRLRLAHSQAAGVVFLTRQGEQHLMLIGERLDAGCPSPV